MTDPKRVAHRLMGIQQMCCNCQHWEGRLMGSPSTVLMKTCSKLEIVQYADAGKDCECFVPRLLGNPAHGSPNRTRICGGEA